MEDHTRQDEIHIVLYRRRLAMGVAAALVLGLGYAVMPSTMTLTTVYPAPSGVYRNLITTRDAFFARDSGNVGIGTTTPGSKLEVNGDIKLSGASANYWIHNVRDPLDNQDVATRAFVLAQVGGGMATFRYVAASCPFASYNNYPACPSVAGATL